MKAENSANDEIAGIISVLGLLTTRLVEQGALDAKQLHGDLGYIALSDDYSQSYKTCSVLLRKTLMTLIAVQQRGDAKSH